MRNQLCISLLFGVMLSLGACKRTPDPHAAAPNPATVPARPEARPRPTAPTPATTPTVAPTSPNTAALPRPTAVPPPGAPGAVRPDTVPRPPRGKMISLIYGGNRQGEVEPCG